MSLEPIRKMVADLEKNLLAIDELNNVCQEAICTGNRPVNLEHCTNILNFLIEPAMFQVEAIRMRLDTMKAAEDADPGAQEGTCS